MKTLIALASASGLTALTQGAIAAPIQTPDGAVHKANWYAGPSYCGPNAATGGTAGGNVSTHGGLDTTTVTTMVIRNPTTIAATEAASSIVGQR
jgi:hypothetical protein